MENAETVYRCEFNQWNNEIVMALPLYSKKPGDLCVSLRTEYIQLRNLNVILSGFWKIRSNFYNKAKSWCLNFWFITLDFVNLYFQ